MCYDLFEYLRKKINSGVIIMEFIFKSLSMPRTKIKIVNDVNDVSAHAGRYRSENGGAKHLLLWTSVIEN